MRQVVLWIEVARRDATERIPCRCSQPEGGPLSPATPNAAIRRRKPEPPSKPSPAGRSAITTQLPHLLLPVFGRGKRGGDGGDEQDGRLEKGGR